uniref:Uncharacterized protein n=1 Tax=Rhizoctonia solani TaxID=456999 RepID=N0ACS9_9AGAM|nr:hypothetical protein RSOL_m00610 [Rhizoctonia solani]AGK45392.1 hypothetical protein RSOL_m00610 [Rhizoctonia solani]
MLPRLNIPIVPHTIILKILLLRPRDFCFFISDLFWNKKLAPTKRWGCWRGEELKRSHASYSFRSCRSPPTLAAC